MTNRKSCLRQAFAFIQSALLEHTEPAQTHHIQEVLLQHAKYPPHMRCAEVRENQFSACSVSVTSSSLS